MRTFLLAVLALLACGGFRALCEPTNNVIVDQFGYPRAAEKIFVVANPQVGQNAPNPIDVGDGSFAVITAGSGSVAYAGTLTPFKAGATDSVSGDVAWRGDFSDLTAPGRYRIRLTDSDPAGVTSYPFDIRDDVYNEALEATVRSFYYQRCGTAIPQKYGGDWHHPACHVGDGQDTEALRWDGSNTSGPAKDVHGGWHDAGDYRKYAPWTFGVLWEMLHAYEWNPSAFGDRTNIPESGNGVPDILDEVRYELDWLMRMQYDDGSVAAVVGIRDATDGVSPPSDDETQRYVSSISTGATSTVAMACALAAKLFRQFDADYADTLQAAAESAWEFLEANTGNIQYSNNGFVQANANILAGVDLGRRVTAAAELYALTGESKYKQYFEGNYDNPSATDNDRQPITDGFDASLALDLQRGLIAYAMLPATLTDSQVVEDIHDALLGALDNAIFPNRGEDPYLSFMWEGHYTWGSNRLKASWGTLLVWAVQLGLYDSDSEREQMENAALDYLHYIHGRNPLSWVYISSMEYAGASKSVSSLYHVWLDVYDDQPEGFPPGFLPGGANQFYEDSANTPVSPPAGEPSMKSYRNWDASWPENSWSVTENAIYYNSAYIHLAAYFATEAKGDDGAASRQLPVFSSLF